jgi:hypothetical protein
MCWRVAHGTEKASNWCVAFHLSKENEFFQ